MLDVRFARRAGMKVIRYNHSWEICMELVTEAYSCDSAYINKRSELIDEESYEAAIKIAEKLMGGKIRRSNN